MRPCWHIHGARKDISRRTESLSNNIIICNLSRRTVAFGGRWRVVGMARPMARAGGRRRALTPGT